jgi:hypothetical protein
MLALTARTINSANGKNGIRAFMATALSEEEELFDHTIFMIEIRITGVL